MKGGEGMGRSVGRSVGRLVGRISAEMVVEMTVQTISASGCEEKPMAFDPYWLVDVSYLLSSKKIDLFKKLFLPLMLHRRQNKLSARLEMV